MQLHPTPARSEFSATAEESWKCDSLIAALPPFDIARTPSTVKIPQFEQKEKKGSIGWLGELES